MSGRPLIEFLLFTLVWVILLIPLRAITKDQPENENMQVEPAQPKEQTTIWIQIRFTNPPNHFTLFSNAKPVWEETDPSLEQEEPVEIKWEDHSQGEMVLHANWEEDTRRVTQVRLSMPEGPAKTCTIWHDGTDLQEALLFQ